jgi:hypothetical protein
VGVDGLAHWDGSTWTADPTVNESIYSLWGSAPNDVWAGGYADLGAILHWDGTKWTGAYALPMPGIIATLWGFAANDVWASGSANLHWDGNSWQPVTFTLNGLDASLGSVWATSKSDIWGVAYTSASNGGQLVHFDGTAWSAIDPGTSEPLTNVWGRGAAGVWVADTNGDTLWHP